MADLLLRASCDDVGLRRESSADVGALPMWLTRLALAIPAGSAVRINVDGDLPVPLATLIEGAGFSGDGPDYVRESTLCDYVAPGMRFLVCGLNPSPSASESGIGFVTNGNRFWPAALESGLVSADRKPLDALTLDGVGFTDLVKRTTVRADEVRSVEFQAGLARLERVVQWLKPKTIVMVGLTGWRLAVGEAKAAAGWQASSLGGCPVYLMPNTSGINTHATLADLVEHLTEAAAGPPPHT